MPESKMHMLAREHFAKKAKLSSRPTLITAGDLQPGMVWVGEKPITVLEVSMEKDARVCLPFDQGRDKVTGGAVLMHMVIIKGTQPNPGFGDFTGTWKVQPDTPIEVTYEL